MSQPRRATHTPARPGPARRPSASTADGLAAQRAAFAERDRRTAQAMTAARRLSHPPRS
jgi:hypothetical protein